MIPTIADEAIASTLFGYLSGLIGALALADVVFNKKLNWLFVLFSIFLFLVGLLQ